MPRLQTPQGAFSPSYVSSQVAKRPYRLAAMVQRTRHADDASKAATNASLSSQKEARDLSSAFATVSERRTGLK